MGFRLFRFVLSLVTFRFDLRVIDGFKIQGCQLYGFIGGLSGFVGFTTLAIMTVDRYLMIRNPLNALKSRSTAILCNCLVNEI